MSLGIDVFVIKIKLKRELGLKEWIVFSFLEEKYKLIGL